MIDFTHDQAAPRIANLLVAHESRTLDFNLREFPIAPNIDAGEGVKMMFAEMASAKLYPPQYRQTTEAAVESVTLTLLNLERPTAWDEVSHWIDTHGEIANRQLRDITKLDTLEASRMLRNWVAQGLLVALPAASRQQARYTKPVRPVERVNSLSNAPDNELPDSKKPL